MKIISGLKEHILVEKIKTNWEAFLNDWESQGVDIIQAQYSYDILQSQCNVVGTITACGNFISYREILEEEWMNKDEYSGNNP